MELEEIKEQSERFRVRLEETRETANNTEKRLLEQTMLKEQAIRETERIQDQLETSSRENERYLEQIQGLTQNNEGLKENLIITTEQVKSLEGDTLRLT